ncbi:MAG TPA: crotonase/enoyl-CoA hydratase family protein [SAR86 cluster bacterium]|mgnify:CR=1 FL=1|nr:crotonase/enoyl-CoA hydratase family protein [SAR86 cluster bacterium]HJM59546.1 crotonase/enoyl-CoA hydratase family protein [SAR86 cluster bacterium]|tara:strand:- start:18174 stop:19052 length:879 start_codon:yes stop_codon:yes gene_type:complete
MNFETIKYEIKEKILTITLNRPDRLNAFTGQMMNELISAFGEAGKDDGVRVVIVTGAGRGFCAGADLGAGEDTFNRDENPRTAKTDDKEDLEWIRDGGGRTTLAIFDCPKPIIAAINGPAVGVGVTMTLPMDIRLASEEARFGFVFARRGLVPEAASSWFLPRIVGISKSLEWTFSGRVFNAAEALEGGLVRSIHSKDSLIDEARSIAKEIIENTSAVSVSMTRHMLWKMLGADHPMEAHQVDSRAIYELGKGRDAKEGVNSFLEKRPPEFPNKVSKDMPDFYPWWEEKEFK